MDLELGLALGCGLLDVNFVIEFCNESEIFSFWRTRLVMLRHGVHMCETFESSIALHLLCIVSRHRGIKTSGVFRYERR
jgi:hypothetical protein